MKSRYLSKKKSELVEILDNLDKEELRGLDSSELSHYTKTELMTEIVKRQDEETTEVYLCAASVADVVEEFKNRCEERELICAFGSLHLLSETIDLFVNGLDSSYAPEINKLAEQVLDHLPAHRLNMKGDRGYTDARRNICDFLDLGYHTTSSEIHDQIDRVLSSTPLKTEVHSSTSTLDLDLWSELMS